MIAGEHDPVVLAQMAKGKLRGKLPQLEEALSQTFRGSSRNSLSSDYRSHRVLGPSSYITERGDNIETRTF